MGLHWHRADLLPLDPSSSQMRHHSSGSGHVMTADMRLTLYQSNLLLMHIGTGNPMAHSQTRSRMVYQVIVKEQGLPDRSPRHRRLLILIIWLHLLLLLLLRLLFLHLLLLLATLFSKSQGMFLVSDLDVDCAMDLSTLL